jgi:hypothetical protein
MPARPSGKTSLGIEGGSLMRKWTLGGVQLEGGVEHLGWILNVVIGGLINDGILIFFGDEEEEEAEEAGKGGGCS